MKRNTPRHPKTAHLASLLQLARWGAVGILESSWHFAAQFAPRGDIGRYTDDEIARGIDWQGQPGPLVQALRTARWIDPCACHRLRLHDWPDHADQTVKRHTEVERHGFLACYGVEAPGPTTSASVELASRASSALASQASQPLPLPLPLPTTPPNPPAVAEGLSDHGPLGEGAVRRACARLADYAARELGMGYLTRRDRRSLLERLRGGEPEADIRAELAAQAQAAAARRAQQDRTRWLIDRARPSGGLLDQLLEAVGARVPPHSFAVWFRPLEDLGVVVDDDGERLLVRAPSDQSAEWIARNYRSALDDAFAAIGRPQMGFTVVAVEPERPQ